MFDNFSQKITKIFSQISGKKFISEDDLTTTLREIRIALLEADVSLPVAKNFIEQVDRVSKCKKEVMKFAKGLDRNAFDALYSVQTTADFDHWLRHVGPYMDTQPVLEYTEPSTLEGLFA